MPVTEPSTGYDNIQLNEIIHKYGQSNYAESLNSLVKRRCFSFNNILFNVHVKM